MTKINVLVIDDDELDRYLATRTLKKFDVFDSVRELGDARDAADLVQSNEFKGLFDSNDARTLVFLDINMPRMTGFEFLECISELDDDLVGEWSDHVVMMLTSSSNVDDMKRADRYEYVKGYIEKPITEEKIDEILSHHYAEVS